jgi:Flp pilus assembly pilin Flp
MERTQAKRVIAQFLRCESGSVAVEYVIMAAAMFLALIPSFLYVASGIGIKFSTISDYFQGS